MSTPAGLPAPLRLERVTERRFRAPEEGPPDEFHRNVVFGGQILAQTIAASHLLTPEKEVKSIHAVFARASRYERPLEYEVESMHSGRAFGSDATTLWQDGKLMARMLVLLHAPEPDLIRHSAPMPAVPGPDDCPEKSLGLGFPGTEQRVVGGVDFTETKPGADPSVFLWVRLPGGDAAPAVAQAMLSWATVGVLIGTAMRPHPIDISQAHRTISTGPLSHTVNFHEPPPQGEWLLFAHESVYAGRGRTHGRGMVYGPDGAIIATFTQDNMVRHVPGGGATSDPSRSM